MKVGDLVEYIHSVDGTLGRIVSNISLVGKRGIVIGTDKTLHSVWKGYYKIMFFDEIHPNMIYNSNCRKCWHECLEVLSESR